LDDRQDILGHLSSFKVSQPQELHTGRKGRQRTRAAAGSARPKLFLMNETKRTAGLTGGNLAALRAAEDARHNERNPKGRSKR
jgi:hypothetical protein